MCCWRRVAVCTALLRTQRLGLGSCDWLWSESPRGRSRVQSLGSARLFSVLCGLCCVPFIQSAQTAHYRGSFSSQVEVAFIRPCDELVRCSCCCCCCSAWAMQANTGGLGGLDSALSKNSFCCYYTACCSYMCIGLNSAEKTSYKSKPTDSFFAYWNNV